jgi:heme-degrading monooxygenase HmoA
MAIKTIIKRQVPEDLIKWITPLLREIRIIATGQPGYISGETLRCISHQDEYIVISTWENIEDWKNWIQSEERQAIQDKIDRMIETKTEYKIYTQTLSDKGS